MRCRGHVELRGADTGGGGLWWGALHAVRDWGALAGQAVGRECARNAQVAWRSGS